MKLEVAFRSPLVHNTDHRAVVATFRVRKTKRLTNYRRRRQRLSLRLPPKLHDELTHTFKALKLTCLEAKPKQRRGNEWILAETWRLISTARCSAGLVSFARLGPAKCNGKFGPRSAGTAKPGQRELAS